MEREEIGVPRITPKPRAEFTEQEGVFDRFNVTMATEIEQRPLALAETHLNSTGWQVGKQASG